MVKRNLIANTLGQGWRGLMGLVFVPFYIHYLGIEAYGVIGLFILLQAWLVLLDMGLRPTLSREMARFTGGSHTPATIRDLLRSIEAVVLAAAVLLFAGVAAASEWLASSWLQAQRLPVEAVAQAFLVMGAVAALRLVEGVYQSSLVGLQRQVSLNVVIAVMATLRGLGAVAVLAWVSASLEAFFVWQGVISLATVAALAALTYAGLPRLRRAARFSLEALRGVRRFAGGVLGITFLALLLTQVDKILLSRLLALPEFGRYALAATVAGALFMLVAPITQAWFPRLSELHARGDDAELARVYHQGAQLVGALVGSVAIVLIVFAEPALELWTRDGELARRVAPLLGLLALGNLLNGLMRIPHQAQLAHGWTGLAVRVNTVAVLVIVPAILWVTPRYGAQGAAWVWVGLNAGYLLLGVQFMYRRILRGEKWRWYREALIQPLAAAAVTAAAVRWLLPATTGAWAQAAGLALAAVLTLAAGVLAAPETRRRARRLLALRPAPSALGNG